MDINSDKLGLASADLMDRLDGIAEEEESDLVITKVVLALEFEMRKDDDQYYIHHISSDLSTLEILGLLEMTKTNVVIEGFEDINEG